jgi:hypothetical protein
MPARLVEGYFNAESPVGRSADGAFGVGDGGSPPPLGASL